MKKIFLALLFVSLVAAPFLVKAQGLSDLQLLVNQLTNQVHALIQAKQGMVLGASTTAATTSPVSAGLWMIGSGSPVIRNNIVVGYSGIMYRFQLTNNGNQDIYVSASSSVAIKASSTNSASGFTMPLLSEVPQTLAGDRTGVYDIPAGTYRVFTVGGTLMGDSVHNAITLSIVGLNYGTSTYNPTGNTVTSGLSDFTRSMIIGLIPTITPTSTPMVADIQTRLSPNSPAMRYVAVSSATATPNVVLGIFSLKSANKTSKITNLRFSLVVPVARFGQFQNFNLTDGTTYYQGSFSNGYITFSNLNSSLAQDTWKDYTLTADVTPYTADNIGFGASASLSSDTGDIGCVDANYNACTVNGSNSSTGGAVISSNVAALTPLTVTVSSLSAQLGSAIMQWDIILGYNTTFNFVLTNQRNATLYVPKNLSAFVGTSTVGNISADSALLSSLATPGTDPNDTANSYAIEPNATRAFSVMGKIGGNGPVRMSINRISFGSSSFYNGTSNITTGLDALQISALMSGSSTLDPVITGVAGPASLAVGQQGTWTVKVTAPTDAYLAYGVDWGDGLPVPVPSPAVGLAGLSNQGTFTHAYQKAGTYTAAFTVANNNQKGGGTPVKTSMTVVVGQNNYLSMAPIATSTLSLQYNYGDPTPDLISHYLIRLTAGSHDIYLPHTSFDRIYYNIRNVTRNQIINLNPPALNSIASSARYVADAQNSTQSWYYIIPAYTTANFQIDTRYHTGQLFAGVYESYFDGLMFKLDSASSSWQSLDFNPLTTNRIAIIGETGPYVTGAGVSPDRRFYVTGERLGNSTVHIGNYAFGSGQVYYRADGGQIDSASPLPTYIGSGSYPLYVEAGSVRSNAISLQVGSSTVADQLRAQINALYAQISKSCTTPVPVPTPLPSTASVPDLQAMIATLQNVIVRCQGTVVTPTPVPYTPTPVPYTPTPAPAKSVTFTAPAGTVTSGRAINVAWNSTGYSDTNTGQLYLYTSANVMVPTPYQDTASQYINSWNLYMKTLPAGAFNPTLRSTLSSGSYKFVLTSNSGDGARYESPIFGVATLGTPTVTPIPPIPTVTPAPVVGKCGSDLAMPLATQPVNLCMAGQPSPVTIDASGDHWNWSCQGSNSQVQMCYANRTTPHTPGPIIGVCGVATALTSNPDALCAVGTPGPVTLLPTYRTWTCSGLNGGAATSCQGPLPIPNSTPIPYTSTPVPYTPTPTPVPAKSLSFTSPSGTVTAGKSFNVAWNSTGYSDTQTGMLYLYTSGGAMVSSPYQDYNSTSRQNYWSLYMKTLPAGAFNPTLSSAISSGQYKFVLNGGDGTRYESPVFTVTASSTSAYNPSTLNMMASILQSMVNILSGLK